MSVRCHHCGASLPPSAPDSPKSSRSWCDDACADATMASEPGWARVEDLDAAARAELAAILGKGAAA